MAPSVSVPVSVLARAVTPPWNAAVDPNERDRSGESTLNGDRGDSARRGHILVGEVDRLPQRARTIALPRICSIPGIAGRVGQARDREGGHALGSRSGGPDFGPARVELRRVVMPRMADAMARML